MKNIKYLGVYLSDDLSLDKDINRALDSFLKQFNSVYHKFKFVDFSILVYLFKIYTSSFYGINLWFECELKESNLHKISVGYHKAVKRVAGLNNWHSNHLACEKCDVNIFKHLFAKKLISHYFRMCNSELSIIRNLKYYFKYCSHLGLIVENVFKKHYGVSNVLNNDISALMSRINFVERSEPRSSYSPL